MFRTRMVTSLLLMGAWPPTSALLLSLTEFAYGQSVSVPGTAGIHLAGQPNGAVLQGDDEGPDSAPKNAPPEIAVPAGGKVTVSATGFTCNCEDCCATTPDGGQGAGIVLGGAYFGLSALGNFPINSLVGVFLGSGPPNAAATPPALNQTQGYTSAAPLLQQVFFIGAGPRSFTVPAGATRLCLGSADSPGTNANNSGAFAVAFSLQAAGPPPVLSSVTNGASSLAGPIAAGEVVVLYGSGMGPAQLTQFRLNEAGSVGAQLADTQVLFNGIPAPILYTWTTQIGAIVPYSVPGTSAQVVVSYQGRSSVPVTVPIAASASGLFTIDATGNGQAAATNQDGSRNSAANPARLGSVLSLYATGEGQTFPAGIDGKPASQPFPQPLLPVTVAIGGQAGAVLYAGGALGLLPGVMQINVRIPNGIQPGNTVPVVLQVGSVSGEAGVTIAVSGTS